MTLPREVQDRFLILCRAVRMEAVWFPAAALVLHAVTATLIVRRQSRS